VLSANHYNVLKIVFLSPVKKFADHFITYLFKNYTNNQHVRRVASWVGLIVLGIEKLAVQRHIPRSRQLHFEYKGKLYKGKFNHHAGSRGGIEIVEIGAGKGRPEIKTVCEITNLTEAAAFYDKPSKFF
jgi:hypothetical protein